MIDNIGAKLYAMYKNNSFDADKQLRDVTKRTSSALIDYRERIDHKFMRVAQTAEGTGDAGTSGIDSSAPDGFSPA